MKYLTKVLPYPCRQACSRAASRHREKLTPAAIHAQTELPCYNSPLCLRRRCPAMPAHPTNTIWAVSSHQPTICGTRLPLPPPSTRIQILVILLTPFQFRFRPAPNALCRRPSRRTRIPATAPRSDVTPPSCPVLHAGTINHPVARLRLASISARPDHSLLGFLRKPLEAGLSPTFADVST
jgi:hypothetical protein